MKLKRVRTLRTIPAIGLGLGLALSCSVPTTAQAQQGAGVSSGSGAGTGTGQSAGSPGSTGTGNESSSGLGGTSGRTRSDRVGQPDGLNVRPGDLTRPGDRRPVAPPGFGTGGLNIVTPQLFLDARSVADPGERALALVRIAQTAIFSKQLPDAHTALFEAGPAALADPDPLIREQRVVAIINALLKLAEERMSDTSNISVDEPPPAAATPSPDRNGVSPSPGLPTPPQTVEGRIPAAALPIDDRTAMLKTALTEWGQALELATKLDKVTARTESLFHIVESEAFSSQRLITDPLRLTGGRPDPSRVANDLRTYTDALMLSSARHAQMIERPIWRNYAKFSIVSNAAVSSQFTRGFEIARGIEQPEARTEALIRLAEGQALNARPKDATAAYEEAARSVALIPQDDPRETLIGVLIDSLISFGRFDDARACVPLYRTSERQLVALSAVAESQGRRGLSEAARIWIGRDTPAEFRPLLYRKVNDGILTSIEQDRSRELSSQGNSPR